MIYDKKAAFTDVLLIASGRRSSIQFTSKKLLEKS